MYSTVFLAMNDRDIQDIRPKKAAYMAMHFSPYSAGLSNAPSFLPDNSLLILDDSMPVQNHDAEMVANQLSELVERFSVQAVLLDFQNSPSKNTKDMVFTILKTLSCPVAVTEEYARLYHCPVFLSPVPGNKCLADYLAPWLQQGVYLDIAPNGMKITVTKAGSQISSIFQKENTLHLTDTRLHCHYNVTVTKEKAVFTLSRTRDDLMELIQEAYGCGIWGAVGLYQELIRNT